MRSILLENNDHNQWSTQNFLSFEYNIDIVKPKNNPLKGPPFLTPRKIQSYLYFFGCAPGGC